MPQSGSLLDVLGFARDQSHTAELITELAAAPFARIERIVSNGQQSAPGF